MALTVYETEIRGDKKMSFQMKHSSSVTGNFNLALDAQIDQH